AEQLGLAAGLEHVGVAGQGVVARPPGDLDRGEPEDLGLGEESEGPLLAQGLEGSLALLEGPAPEGKVGEIDLVERERLAWLHVWRLTPGLRRRTGIGVAGHESPLDAPPPGAVRGRSEE